MLEKSANLAIVSNNTFEAIKPSDLNHYDISIALQTTLEFDELISIFSSKIQNILPHNGFIYSNDEFDLEIKNGIMTRNACTYALEIEGQQLGRLKLMRRQKFSETEMKFLESLLCCLIYPLRNATLFRQATNMAYTDSLTQTRNRAAFNDTISREMHLANRNNKNLGLIFMDIDHFKMINDQFGHKCGDIALASVAKRIKENIRSSDIIFRYGGEEFVILLSDTDMEGTRLLAERIRQNIESHTLAYGLQTLKITVSLGISTLRSNDSIENFMMRADQALYKAKKNGRNRVVAG
ncbi:MAG: GGDEF domain-containing protein [Gammaproteobacteria bacterium]